MRDILHDLRTLERAWDEGRFERGVRRIGAEQEVFLIGEGARPAPIATEVLARLEGPYTHELALFNIEANLPPIELRGDFLRRLEAELSRSIQQVQEAAGALGADVLLTGILPTLEEDDVGAANMTPLARYAALNDGLVRGRGRAFDVAIHGIDDLETVNPTVMLQSANTSFQLHLQVETETFVRLYNLIQVLTGPVLAPAVNSPTLLGRRLWHETRIALFERSIDGRSFGERVRGRRTRVGFGEDWVREGAVELFREDVARYRPILVRDGPKEPLGALALFNGTVWRWNRPCFGIVDGVAHVRIENRVLPSGPSVHDAIANAALFYGMVLGLDAELEDVTGRIRFDDVRHNFLAAARDGLGASFHWLDGRQVSANALLLDELLPAAERGLGLVGVPPHEIGHWLETIEKRVASGQTGSQWTLDGLDALSGMAVSGRLRRVTETMLELQQTGAPVHEWPPMRSLGVAVGRGATTSVREIMSTDLITIRAEDVVDLAAAMMQWHDIQNVPVEDHSGQVVGLVDRRALDRAAELAPPVAVRDVMWPDPPSVAPDVPVTEAARRLSEADVQALLVVAAGRLVGIVSEDDLP